MTEDEISRLPYRPCAGVMLVNPLGRVFVGQRIDRDSEAWQMPQGGIDPGEDPREAALRELEEEIGVVPTLVTVEAETPGWIPYDLPRHLVPKVWGGRYRGQQQRWFLMRFRGADSDIRIETAHPEFTAWQWIPPDELIERIVPFKRDVYARVLDTFRSHL